MAEFHYRILMVDDDEAVRRTSADLLSCGGMYEVLTAKDGFEALVLLRKALPDLIVTDLKMPGMSGFELLSIVRRRFPHIPVIAITGEYSASADTAGLLADALFHKGEYAPASLVNKARSLLEQSPMRPHLHKPDKAPVWIPRNGNYYVLTCTECLRSFSVPSDGVVDGPQETPCLSCGTEIRFVLESKE